MNEKTDLYNVSSLYVDEVGKLIEKTWFKLRDDPTFFLWRYEIDLVSSFYYYLRLEIEKLNYELLKINKKIQFIIAFEYNPEPSTNNIRCEKTYPLSTKKSSKRFKCDLAIIAYDDSDYREKIKQEMASYWCTKHVPLILLEFKFLDKKDIIRNNDGLKSILEKYIEIKTTYKGVERLYICILTDKEITRNEVEQVVKKIDEQKPLGEFFICYVTYYKEACSILNFPNKKIH